MPVGDAISALVALRMAGDWDEADLDPAVQTVLEKYGDEGVTELARLLEAGTEDQTRGALELLKLSGKRAVGALDGLRAQLRSPSRFSNDLVATRVLAGLGRDAAPAIDDIVKVLETYLADENLFGVEYATGAVLAIGNPEAQKALPALLRVVRSGADSGLGMIRGSAALSVARIGVDDPAVVESIAALLDDDDADNVSNAVKALGEIGALAASALEKLKAMRTDASGDLAVALDAAIAAIEGE